MLFFFTVLLVECTLQTFIAFDFRRTKLMLRSILLRKDSNCKLFIAYSCPKCYRAGDCLLDFLFPFQLAITPRNYLNASQSPFLYVPSRFGPCSCSEAVTLGVRVGSSPDKYSRVRRFVSGISNEVKHPHSMNSANICIT